MPGAQQEVSKGRDKQFLSDNNKRIHPWTTGYTNLCNCKHRKKNRKNCQTDFQHYMSQFLKVKMYLSEMSDMTLTFISYKTKQTHYLRLCNEFPQQVAIPDKPLICL